MFTMEIQEFELRESFVMPPIDAEALALSELSADLIIRSLDYQLASINGSIILGTPLSYLPTSIIFRLYLRL